MVYILVLSHEDLRNPIIYSFFVCVLNIFYKNRVGWQTVANTVMKFENVKKSSIDPQNF